MQLNMNLNVPTRTMNAWAFATDITKSHNTTIRRQGRRAFTASRNLNQCVITAASREAKALGIRVGMRYTEAKALVPDLRILVSNA